MNDKPVSGLKCGVHKYPLHENPNSEIDLEKTKQKSSSEKENTEFQPVKLCKSLSLSKLIYSASLLSIPKGLVEKINKIILTSSGTTNQLKLKEKLLFLRRNAVV